MTNQVVSLWLKSEIFSIGSLPISPNSRLTVNNIKKIIPYVKSRDKRNHPNLSYSVWKHIACNKLMHSEEIAWIYFWVFDTLLDKTPEERLLHWDSHAYATKAGDAQAEQERGQLTVPALPFTLFLFIQHLHKISLKASLVTGSDEWPSRTRSPDVDSRLNVSGCKGSDESAQLNFVMNNLNDILDLLVVEDGQQNKKDATVPLRSLEALEFFIVGSINKAKDIKPLRELAILQAQKTGYCKTTASFSFKGLQTWLRSNLTQNPFGTSNCLSQGRNLCWPLQGESREKWSETKKGNILTNAVFVPKEHSKGNKLIILNQMCKTTIARSSGTLEGSSVRISRCNNSFIYLLSPLRSVIIEKCQRSTIILGAVETSIDLNRCEQVTVIGVARRFSAQGCKSCNIHMLTPNTPLLFNNNSQLIFGPYHTFYPQLEEHMCVSGLSPVVNLWDSPIILGTGNVTEEKIFELQKPSDFYPFEIPFEMEGRTKDIPLGLPVRYQRALVQRKKKLEEWQKYLSETPLNSDQKKLLHQSVQAKFQEFLQMSGYAGYLESLATSADQNESSYLCEKMT